MLTHLLLCLRTHLQHFRVWYRARRIASLRHYLGGLSSLSDAEIERHVWGNNILPTNHLDKALEQLDTFTSRLVTANPAARVEIIVISAGLRLALQKLRGEQQP